MHQLGCKEVKVSKRFPPVNKICGTTLYGRQDFMESNKHLIRLFQWRKTGAVRTDSHAIKCCVIQYAEKECQRRKSKQLVTALCIKEP